ncbi:ABC transporter family substrate-binding protein [Streptomyces beijiangensis]|uniref:ABC transporter family substrate-binding protein n=1 Tax=Streptomyces beijiangensis TaxID=163361 RepID=A0A939JJM6_9ACTN|nr:ABC transporter family substrate-binding protein [Streptomyces beijiangensis]MBO0514922.1 ABC transporter family substrate-binding protein [Streptomyces beijiangensis]
MSRAKCTLPLTLLTTGVLALAGCGASNDADSVPAAPQDVAPAGRAQLADGGTLRWAVDAMPETLNAFQADADATTTRITGAVLPSLFTLDANGRPQANPDYLESAKTVAREPKQVVLYRLNQKAVWSDGREIGAPDFVAQWHALSGKDSSYWTARNAGYDRIEKIERGADNLEVKVTFNKPYADWRSLFSPLYPKEVMGSPAAFNDAARTALKSTAGPFRIKEVDRSAGTTTLVRNPRWWGTPAKLDALVLTAVPREKRTAALAAGSLDLADVDTAAADRITRAVEDKNAGVTGGPAAAITPASALRSWALAHGSEGEEKADAARTSRKRTQAAIKVYDTEQTNLRGYAVRKSLEPAYTQLALNGSAGPLSDERVRRAVARALNRKELAADVLKPLGLPAEAPGSHLALAGQEAYADNSDALGDQDTHEAQALLADAGWKEGGAVATAKPEGAKAGSSPQKESKQDGSKDDGKDDGTHTDGQGRGVAGAYAPTGTRAPAGGVPSTVLTRNGKPLTLRFVLPSGPGSESLRATGDRIAQMLDAVGIRTEVTKVADDSYFKDHIASGDYDLALYSWPATAYPATDARPIYAKPEPAADGSLTVEQNYTRVGTDHIDQLFDQAVGELDEGASRDLVEQADARIWAAAGSIPLYQRPQLVAARQSVANAGAFGFQTPRYQDIGFTKGAAKS